MKKEYYYYFLFRIYRFYKDRYKESESQALFSATAVSTSVISINLFSLYGVISYSELFPTLKNKYYGIFIMIFIGIIYCLLIKRNF